MNSAPRFTMKYAHLCRHLFQAGLAVAMPALFGQPSNIELPEAAKGERAIEVLGGKLPEVADYYGMKPNELAQLLRLQRSLGVDQKGALLYACEGLAVSAAGGNVSANMMPPDSSVTILANGGTVDAFKLHSLPGVKRIIYLDFTGHTTTGTSWNNTSRPSITSAPFSLDGDPNTFNDTERTMIQRIWQRVAEDYAPFGVDVTTEEPLSIEGLRKTTSGDTEYGIRVVISPTNWYNTGAGGVAYIGCFSWNSDTPCFAFTQQLANGEKYIAECVSHEVGHTVSLNHDGASGTEYYQGQGNWAPIMGVGYYKPLVQFSKGEYAGANNTQDDLAVMLNHFPLAVDDHGNSTGNATPLAGPNVKTGGTIETRTDVDVFRFDSGAGPLALTIQGPAPDTNVDLKAELLDAGGTVILTSDSTSVYSATLSTTVAAGTYYVRLSSVGVGDPATTGYSSYASIGNYLITGTISTGGTNQPPTAVATATSATTGTAPLTVSFTSEGSSDPENAIVGRSWNFGDGSTGTGMTASTTYNNAGTYSVVLSVVDNGNLSDTDTVVVTVNPPAPPPNTPPTAVASAASTTVLELATVQFSSAGSNDSDGIASYLWSFSDGGTSTAANPSRTYATVGTYTATLTVTDTLGATSAPSSVTITVEDNPNLNVDVSAITLVASTAKGGSTGLATIYVRDATSPVAGVAVSVQWSGVVSGNSTGTTDATGKVILTSPKTKKGGNVSVTVSNVVPPAGRAWDQARFNPPNPAPVRLN
jgi:PKD repeat protein